MFKLVVVVLLFFILSKLNEIHDDMRRIKYELSIQRM